jgi:transcriptional regulator with XRE-family HTH domain
MTALDLSITTSAFAGNLRAERARAAITQQELADRAGITRNAVISYEGGATTPNIETLIRLADALSIDPASLVPSLPDSSAAWPRTHRGS